MQGGNLDAALQEIGHNGSDFVFRQHNVTHQHGAILRWLKCHPSAKGQGWLDRHAAIAGLGVTRVLSYQVAAPMKAGLLNVVLQELEPAPSPVSLVYSGQRRLPLKLRAFLESTIAESCFVSARVHCGP